MIPRICSSNSCTAAAKLASGRLGSVMLGAGGRKRGQMGDSSDPSLGLRASREILRVDNCTLHLKGKGETPRNILSPVDHRKCTAHGLVS